MAPSLALSRLLDELSSVIIDLPPELYRTAASGGVSGSIGEHVRHCLDHVSALVAAGSSGTLTYDHRQRGTSVETEPGAALQQMCRLKAALERWPALSLDERVCVESRLSRRSRRSQQGDSITAWSTLARELAFVISHTIHHQAIIALLVTMHGYSVPDRFGRAPSTPDVKPTYRTSKSTTQSNGGTEAGGGTRFEGGPAGSRSVCGGSRTMVRKVMRRVHASQIPIQD